MQKVGTELEKIGQYCNLQDIVDTASGIGGRNVTIPGEPAFSDGIKRRLEVYKTIYEMAQIEYSSIDSELLMVTTPPIVAAVFAGNEISTTIIDCLRKPELVQDIEGAKKEVEYVNL